MSDTPETDQASRECHNMPDPGLFVSSDFCRKLERERDEARRIAAVYRSVVLLVADAVDEVPNPDPVPWEDSSANDKEMP